MTSAIEIFVNFGKQLVDGLISFGIYLLEIWDKIQFVLQFLPLPLVLFFSAFVALTITLRVLDR